MRDLLKISNIFYNELPINHTLFNNYFTYLTGLTNYNGLGNSSNLFKSQYRPMKKGIINMIRLQATNAVAMPIEIRLHIMASSKDVIHS